MRAGGTRDAHGPSVPRLRSCRVSGTNLTTVRAADRQPGVATQPFEVSARQSTDRVARLPVVPENPSVDELRERLDGFVRYRKEHLTGDEKGEAQLFLENLFRALGHEGLRQAGATLEMRVARTDNRGTAYADLVWKPRVLVEMKKSGRDLRRDYRQAFEYWMHLVPDRPRYVVLCNFDEFWVYDLDLQLEEPVDRVALDDLPQRWEVLAFLLPVEERPAFGNDLVAVTRDSAAKVSAVFNRLVARSIQRDVAQRFILQAVMAMFAEDIGLLPRHSFTQAVEDSLEGGSAYDLVFGLFREMNSKGTTPGGRFAGTPYFNGGLFADVDAFELKRDELEQLHVACQEDWAAVRPVIFGTLFEQSLDKPERHAYGAYFTSETDIQKVVLPTIVRPWRERIEAANTLEELGAVENDLLSYRVLDPACGSGNFLYVAYRELRRLERQLSDKVQSRRRTRGAEAEMRLSFVSTTQFYGIDARPFAVEVAKVTLMLARKLAADELEDERTVLPLDDLDDNFIAKDALRVDWPPFEACIGNPPYLGRRRIIEEKSADYAAWLGEEFPDIGGVSDYVSYWFRKAHDLLPHGARAGLVGTNTIRQGDTRRATLDHITANDGVIYDAVSSQPWSGDAVVAVSIVNWAKGVDVVPKTLWLSDGTVKLEVDHIPGSLSPDIDVAEAPQLRVNRDPKVCFQGQTPGHTEGFVLTREQAEEMVARDPVSAEVVHPFLTGEELNSTGKPGRYVIDIPSDDAAGAARWKAALAHVRQHVLPTRQGRATNEAERNAEVLTRNPNAKVNWHHRRFLEFWWQHSYRRADMVRSIAKLERYIALSIVAVEDRPSIYAFVSPDIWPAASLQVFAFDDDYSFGLLTSQVHRRWFEARASSMRTDLRYTPNTVFDSFPWPQAPTDETAGALCDAVEQLLAFRDERLHDGITLGAQYASLRDPGRNELRRLHERLDAAVSDLYGFSAQDDMLAQLLALNESISEEENSGITQPRRPGPDGIANATRTSSRLDAPPPLV